MHNMSVQWSEALYVKPLFENQEQNKHKPYIQHHPERLTCIQGVPMMYVWIFVNPDVSFLSIEISQTKMNLTGVAGSIGGLFPVYVSDRVIVLF